MNYEIEDIYGFAFSTIATIISCILFFTLGATFGIILVFLLALAGVIGMALNWQNILNRNGGI